MFTWSVDYLEFVLLSFLSLFIYSLYALMTFYIVYCTIKLQEVKEFYNIKKSIKLHGIRSFSTAGGVVHVCKLCGKVAVGFGIGCGLGPKILTRDWSHRVDFWNEITYPYLGLKVRSAYDVKIAFYLLDRYPEDKELISPKWLY